jgi:5-methylcytosine-specific restriction endonuclease McrA
MGDRSLPNTRKKKQSSWYKKDKKANPRKYRLKNIFNSLERREGRKLSEDERDILAAMFDANLAQPCDYCSTSLTIKNISCDHVFPISRGGEKTIENLQFICLPCNMMKGNLTGEEFTELMTFLNQHENIKKIVSQRLKMSGIVFAHRR